MDFVISLQPFAYLFCFVFLRVIAGEDTSSPKRFHHRVAQRQINRNFAEMVDLKWILSKLLTLASLLLYVFIHITSGIFIYTEKKIDSSPFLL